MTSRALAWMVGLAAAIVLIAAAMAPRLLTGGHAGAAALPSTGMYLALDCDPATGGIQDNCLYPEGTANVDVDVVLVNIDVAGGSVAGFNFNLVTDQTVLDPILTGNPERNPTLAGTWSCDLPAPVADADPDSFVADSFLSCFDPVGSGAPVPPASSVKLATVHYTALGGFAYLAVPSAAVADQDATERVACNPFTSQCAAASITISNPTATPSNTPTPTATLPPPTPTCDAGECATPIGVPTGAPNHVLALNSGACLPLSIAFGGLTTIQAAANCFNLQRQHGPTGSLQSMVECLRGGDFDGNGTHDCLYFGSEVLQVVPEDFVKIDRDRDQVRAGVSLYVLAFVDADYPVAFSTDKGTFKSFRGDSLGSAYTCFNFDPQMWPYTGDPDCDGGSDTRGDGVVVARLEIDQSVARGPGHVTVTQGATSIVLDFDVVGVPVAISFETLAGKTSIETGATVPLFPWETDQPPLPTDCLFGMHALDGLPDRPEKAVVLTRALDSDGKEVAGTLLEWEHPFRPSSVTTPVPQGGVALPQVPTFDLGGGRSGGLQVICGGSEPGLFASKVRISPVIDTNVDRNYEATYSIEVVAPATVTPTPSPTDTPVPTDTATPTPSPTATPVAADTATSTPMDIATAAPSTTATAAVTRTVVATASPVVSSTAAATLTAVPTVTNTPTAVQTAPPTRTATPDPRTATPVDTATPTATATSTSTSTPTNTPTPTSTPQLTSTAVILRTHTPTRTSTAPARTATAPPVLPAVTRTPSSGVLADVATPRPRGIVLPETGDGAARGHTQAEMIALALGAMLIGLLALGTRAVRRR